MGGSDLAPRVKIEVAQFRFVLLSKTQIGRVFAAVNDLLQAVDKYGPADAPAKPEAIDHAIEALRMVYQEVTGRRHAD